VATTRNRTVKTEDSSPRGEQQPQREAEEVELSSEDPVQDSCSPMFDIDRGDNETYCLPLSLTTNGNCQRYRDKARNVTTNWFNHAGQTDAGCHHAPLYQENPVIHLNI